MRLTIGEVLEATGGRLIFGSPDQILTGISTDSRTVEKRALFFALQGTRFDGHAYVEASLKRGASGAVISRSRVAIGGRRAAGAIVMVDDTLRALGDLAAWWRRRFAIPVVAVTGSNGKTTTKEMIAALLAEKFRVLKTEKNFNNLIGLPLTLLKLTSRHQAAVVEMGMNAPGEIARLTEIAAPRVGVITNVGRAHLEGLRSLARVARAKGELAAGLPPGGLAVLNRDDCNFGLLRSLSPARVQTFGRSRASFARLLEARPRDLRGMTVRARLGDRELRFSLKLLGRHNVTNALAALAVGDHFGLSPVSMARALARLSPRPSRMEPKKIRRGRLIDDTYNANPDSMKEALEFLRGLSGRRRVAILGEMLELGKFSRRAHEEVGARAVAAAQLVIAVGHAGKAIAAGARRAGGTRTVLFPDLKRAVAGVARHLESGDLILVKGSRGARMEQVVAAIRREN